MAEIVKTIKPAGSGDYATLALWETAAGSVSEASGDVWSAEMYEGNAGQVTLAGWSLTPTALKFSRIFPAAGAGHAGQAGTTGLAFSARITIEIPYTQVTGIKLFSTLIQSMLELAGANCVADNVMVEFSGAVDATMRTAIVHTSAVHATARNIFILDSSTSGASANLRGCFHSSGTMTCEFWTIRAAGTPRLITGFHRNLGTLTVTDCIVTGCSASFNTATGVTQSHNTTDDAGAVGTSPQTGVTAASLFPVVTNLATVNSGVIDAGLAIVGVTTDAFGTTRADPPTRGCYELPPAATKPFFFQRHILRNRRAG